MNQNIPILKVKDWKRAKDSINIHWKEVTIWTNDNEYVPIMSDGVVIGYSQRTFGIIKDSIIPSEQSISFKPDQQ